jgi:hypothetical protein
MIKVVGPYQAMLALPNNLDAVQARARAIYASGWRPPIPPGPTREELAELVTAAASCQGHRTEDAALFAAIAGQCPGRSARAKRGNRASTVWGGRPSHVVEAPWLPRRPSRRPATSHVSSRT